MSPSFLETGSRLRPLETWAISSGEGRVIQRKELKTQRAEGRAQGHEISLEETQFLHLGRALALS